MSSLETITPIGTRVSFKNPPNGENLTPTVTAIQVTGRGTFKRIGGTS